LAAGLDTALGGVEAVLRGKPDEALPQEALPDLRAHYLAFARAAPGEARREALDELDEVVDAANSLAALTAQDDSSPSDAGRSQAEHASVLHS
jgi:hypothetical protein